MRATISRTDLVAALRVVQPAATKRGQGLPILAGVRLVVGDDSAMVTCSNIDLTIDTFVTVGGGTLQAETETGTAIVPVELLARIVGAMAGEYVDLETVEEQLAVTSGQTSAQLATFNETEWPRGLMVKGEPVKLDDGAMEILGHAIGFAAREAAHGAMTGVLIGTRGIVATDSYVGIEYHVDGLPDAIIPVETLTAVVRGTSGPLTVTSSERSVAFSDGATIWTSSVIGGNFPDFSGLLSAERPNAVAFDREEFLEGLARMQSVAERFTVTFEVGSCLLSAWAPDVGEISDELECVVTGEPGPVTFKIENLRHLIEAVADDTIELEFSDATKPAVVRTASLAMLCMPIHPTAK